MHHAVLTCLALRAGVLALLAAVEVEAFFPLGFIRPSQWGGPRLDEPEGRVPSGSAGALV